MAAGGFSKFMVMIPVMLAARKIDAEDPQVIYYLRIAYGSVQALCALAVIYTYIQASALGSASSTSSTSSSSDANINKVVYVPAAPTPFADPNAKKKYTEVEYGAHVLTTARSLLFSTLFGIVLTVGLHLYKGMAMGLAIQAVMGPLNLWENPIVKAVLMGNGFQPDDKIFEEKTVAELTAEDEIVDASGNVVVRQVGDGSSTSAKPKETFEEILLDTWDAGNKADLTKLMSTVNKKNCNSRTKENSWTPLMILAGLNAKGTASAIRQIKELGGNPAIVDAEGWNALHWAAFHGSLEAATELVKDTALLTVKDKEGKLPIDMAKSEGNGDVATFLEGEMESKKSK